MFRQHVKLVTLLTMLIISASGCTTIGMHNADKLATMDFGDRVTMNICILQDISVEDSKVDGIIKEMKDELIQYNINVEISWVRLWYRPGFMGKKAFDNVALKPLAPPCDRLFALSSRHAGDFFWGLLLPEYLGMVDGLTYTKGYSVAEWGSLNQCLIGPRATAVHELYHLLGCGHGLTMSDCYDQIKKLKEVAIREQNTGNDFFPTITKDGVILRSRSAVDALLYEEAIIRFRSE